MSATLLSRAFGAALALAFVPAAASAATLYQSASYVDTGGVDNGDYIVRDGFYPRYIGGTFTLTGQTRITDIGGQFGLYPGGTVFGAIVQVDPQTGFPIAAPLDLQNNALASVVFSVPGDAAPLDLDEALAQPLVVGAGTYAVVFGSGQFGASGYAGFGDANDPVGTSTLFTYDPLNYGENWAAFDDNGVRVFVQGSAVPEPASWAMMVGGFALAGGAMRRRRTTVRFA